MQQELPDFLYYLIFKLPHGWYCFYLSRFNLQIKHLSQIWPLNLGYSQASIRLMHNQMRARFSLIQLMHNHTQKRDSTSPKELGIQSNNHWAFYIKCRSTAAKMQAKATYFQPAFSVTHCSRRIRINRTKISMTSNKWVTQGEILEIKRKTVQVREIW